jgi:NADPH:quinone reductase-like Zn-dependent oxidoreductase
LEKFGTVEGIVLREELQPVPKPTEIVLRVRATSLNRRDIMILHGTYPLPAKPDIVPLSDGAGEVVAIGSAVKRFTVGDRVTGSYFARWRDGDLAPDVLDQLGCTLDGLLTEYAVLDEQWAVRVPDHLTWEQAATLSCAGVTAWHAVVGIGQVRPGQTVLVLGTGGVSLFALQFAKLAGCRVIAATSREPKVAKLQALGADDVVNYATTPTWGTAVRELTGGAGVDLVVETMGPDTIEQSVIASARYGQIVLLITKSANKSVLEISGDAYARSLTTIRRLFVGSRATLEAMTKAVAAHRLQPVIDRVFSFAEARDAFGYLMKGDVFGKVIILGA